MSLLPSSMYNTRRGYALAQWLLQDVQYVANILSTLLGDTGSFDNLLSALQLHAKLERLRHRSGCHAGHTRIVATLALVNTNVCPRLHADYVTVSPFCGSVYLKGLLDPAMERPPLCVMHAGAGAVHLLWTGHRVCCQQRRGAAAPAAPSVQRH